MPKLLQVIESEVPRGDGTEFNPCRNVVQYHTTDGQFLAENDPSPEVDCLQSGQCFTQVGSRFYHGGDRQEGMLVFDSARLKLIPLDEWNK